MTAGGQDAIFPLCSSYHFLWYPRFRNPFLSPEAMWFIGRDGTLGIHPRRKLKIWVQTQRLSLVSAYQLGWSPSSRDNIAAGISREAPSKLSPRELSTREPQWGSSCTVIWEHKPYHGAWGKRKNVHYWNIIKIKCDQGLLSPWVWGVSLRYLWFLI